MLKEALANYNERLHKKTKRSNETYAATAAYVIKNINRLLKLYHKTKNDEQTKRLIRDDIDHLLRRYHGYCIKEKIGSHYIDRDLKDAGIFEHIVPNSTIRDLLIAKIITPIQACNMPTARITKEKDEILKKNGWATKSPDIYNFWERYKKCFIVDGKFTTYDGHEVDTNMTLDDHFKLFG